MNVYVRTVTIVQFFDFPWSKITEALNPTWIQSSGSQWRFSCPGLVYLKLLASAVIQQHTPWKECFSGVTRLKLTRLDCQRHAISSAPKKSRVKATTLSLVKTSVNWIIELWKQARRILCRIGEDTTWNGQLTEVYFTFVNRLMSGP